MDNSESENSEDSELYEQLAGSWQLDGGDGKVFCVLPPSKANKALQELSTG